MFDWQPIDDAPRDGRDVLVCNESGDMFVAWYDLGRWVYAHDKDGGLIVCKESEGCPTHWMPLPNPPAT